MHKQRTQKLCEARTFTLTFAEAWLGFLSKEKEKISVLMKKKFWQTSLTFAGSKPVMRGKSLSVSDWNVLPALPTMCALLRWAKNVRERKTKKSDEC